MQIGRKPWALLPSQLLQPRRPGAPTQRHQGRPEGVFPSDHGSQSGDISERPLTQYHVSWRQVLRSWQMSYEGKLNPWQWSAKRSRMSLEMSVGRARLCQSRLLNMQKLCKPAVNHWRPEIDHGGMICTKRPLPPPPHAFFPLPDWRVCC